MNELINLLSANTIPFSINLDDISITELSGNKFKIENSEFGYTINESADLPFIKSLLEL